MPRLSAPAFFAYRKSGNRPVIDWLKNGYQPLDKRFLADIRRSLNSIADIIKKLKDYRDKCIAHDDMVKKLLPINRTEIRKVFKVLEQVLNKLSLKLDFSTWSYRDVAPTSERQTKSIITVLSMRKKR